MRFASTIPVLCCLTALLSGCATRNVGDGPLEFFLVELTSIIPADPAGLFGCGDATFNAAISGGVPPYTYQWDFGGAVTPNTAVSPPGVSTSTTQTLNASNTTQTHTITVTATDGSGILATDIMVITIGAAGNRRPRIDAAAYFDGVLTVIVSDLDSCGTYVESLAVSAIPPDGIELDSTYKVAAMTGPLTAEFLVSATDILAGGAGSVALTVSDGNGGYGSYPGGVLVAIAPITVPADSLVCIPLVSEADFGDEVPVVVVTGEPANPFQYMVGCGLTIESDAQYVTHSFDVGSADPTPDVGSVNPADDIWAAMNPAGGFLLAPDHFIQRTDIGGGRERWDFNITPLGGSNQAAPVGAVFNCIFTFATAGTKTFGFEEFNGVKRTYYADDATEYFWDNIANDGSVAPNSVTID